MRYRFSCLYNSKWRYIEVYPFLFLLTELSSSSDFVAARIPENIPDISYYANREGELTPLIAGCIPGAAADPPLLVGVNIDGHIHPIFDRRRRWIMVHLLTRQIIPVNLNLYQAYSYAFPDHTLARLENNNNGELVMPFSRHSNVEHLQPCNVRFRHK